MKDKEKQIEEMAKDLSDCLQYEIEDRSVDEYDTAFRLANKGWIKLPKDARVFIPKNGQYKMLSREEYDLLINIKEFFETAYSEISAGNLLVYLKEFKEEASKETAEKIYKDLKLLVPDNALGIVTRYFKEIMEIEIKE